MKYFEYEKIYFRTKQLITISRFLLISNITLKMSIKKYLGIGYKLASSENFDEYMKALGIGALNRKMGNMAVPTVVLTEKDGIYTFTTSSTFKTTVIHFKPGVEFDEETADGRKVQSVVTFDNNVMIHTQKGEKTSVIVREFMDDELKMTCTVGTVKSTRIYRKT